LLEFKLQQIPVASVVNHNAQLAIAAGAEIDPHILASEIAETKCQGRLIIDRQATILDAAHSEAERAGEPHGQAGITKEIGSTGKGVGAARADRLWRKARIVDGFDEWPNVEKGDVASLAREWLWTGGTVMVEGTQGFGLGLHAGYYPFCTSSDCRAIDFLSMAGISPWWPEVTEFEVWVVLRTYPIRVAGNSGPLRNETSWGKLSKRTDGYIQSEKTTVTKKVRRVGEWDDDLAAEAIQANGGPSRTVKVALTFIDYWFPSLAERREFDRTREDDAAAWKKAVDIAQIVGVPVSIWGTGPRTVMDFRP
jgi:adenylosuccinate synthase